MDAMYKPYTCSKVDAKRDVNKTDNKQYNMEDR